MREPAAHGLTGIMLVGLSVLTGCSSTSALPSTLSRSPANKQTLSNEIAWKKTNPTPSTAMSHDSWNNPQPIQKTTFQNQPLPQVEIPPIPEVMLKERDDAHVPRVVQAQPASFKHGGRHQGASTPVPAPGAPSESSPIRLEYRIRPPDVLWIESLKGLVTQPVGGPHTVRPDGTVGIGVYGSALVAGRTLDEARIVIAAVIHSKLDKDVIKLKDVEDNLNVNILAFNSSFYYVIVDGAGLGEQVHRFPVTGHETVLDAISLTGGLQLYSSPKRIWVARPNSGHLPDSILPVDWRGITQAGDMNTNWQVMPGDRVYVQADPMRRFNNNLAKYLQPVKEILGTTLLGSQTVNSIRSGSVVGSNNISR